jgi:hypothetical protein
MWREGGKKYTGIAVTIPPGCVHGFEEKILTRNIWGPINGKWEMFGINAY